MKVIILDKILIQIGSDDLEFIDKDGDSYYISADCDWFVNSVDTTREDALYQLLSTISKIEVQLIDGEFHIVENRFEYDELNIIVNRDENEDGDEFTESLKLHDPD